MQIFRIIPLFIVTQGFRLCDLRRSGIHGIQNLEAVIRASKDVVDISFPKMRWSWTLWQREQVTAIVDCGGAPGMGNLILGYYNERMTITDF